YQLIKFGWMNVRRPHGGSKRIRFGNFVVWFRCASLRTMFVAILVLTLQFGYWISSGIKQRALCLFLSNQWVPFVFVKPSGSAQHGYFPLTVSSPFAPCFFAILVLALALQCGYPQALARDLCSLVWNLIL
ncbi:hypothetical protein MTR67_030611, partial [Solanum verrucosum]